MSDMSNMSNLPSFTHFDAQGQAIMVDVSQKQPTTRVATASGAITMSKDSFAATLSGQGAKGDVLNVARIAGIMATKNTATLIPLCHSIPIEKVTIQFATYPNTHTITATCTVATTGKTGVEMEALTGVSVCLLTIYDMVKAMDKSMEIGHIALLKKEGGKSGVYVK